ncbi:condensation domain-containing protein [Actinophytocola sp.]|uniref:condensation domain-containing protein n=1 Tax=Actinophytocola sp. TaxID=1872138 RepID=UPI002ED7E939
MAPQQEQLHADELFRPDTCRNVVAMRVTMSGPVDVDALDRAVRLLGERQAMLRAGVGVDDLGDPVLAVAGATPTLTRLAAAPTAVAALASEPFGCLAGPLVRFTWWPVTASTSTLLVSAHHLVLDGASGPLLVDGLAAGYRAAAEDPVPDYRAYATERAGRAWAPGEDDADRHWSDYLAGIAGAPLWPPRQGAVGAGSVRRRLDPGTAARLTEFAAAHRVSPMALVLAGTAAAVATETARDDLLIGVAYADRDAEYDRTIGNFVDVLPVRMPAPQDRAAAPLGLLPDAREGLLNLLEYGDVPSSRIFRRAGLRNPIEVSVSMRRAWEHSVVVGDSTWTMSELVLAQSPYPCSVDVAERQDGGLEIAVHHDRTRLDDGAAHRILAVLTDQLALGKTRSGGTTQHAGSCASGNMRRSILSGDGPRRIGPR